MSTYAEFLGHMVMDDRHAEIVGKLEVIVATVQAVAAQVTTLKTELTGMLSRIAADVDKLKADVAAGQVDAAALDAISTQLGEAIATVKAVDPLPENPPAA